MKYKLIAKPNKNYSPMQQILVNRGIDVKDIEHYLKTSDADILNPDLLDNMAEGVKRLVSAIKNQEKMFLIVDCDADGFTASAALVNYIYKVFPSAMDLLSIQLHEGKEHGIEEKWLEEIVANEYKLVICPDASSNDYEQHKFLKDNGIDVLVLDHHDAEEVSENAIIINNQLSDYPNKTLSGVGVVYKFCSKIDELMKIKEADTILDLVSLGMIADMMDMRNFETKHLIQKGLTRIENPFFKALVERQAYSIGETVTPIGVAFYIAPLINATIRVGTQAEKEVMFKAMLNHCAYDMIPSTKRGEKGKTEAVVVQAVRNATNVRNRQKKARDNGFEYVEQIIAANNLDKNKIIVVQVSEDLDKNLTGLIANQLMAKYQKPVLLVRETDEGLLQGSARGYDKSELKDLKSFLLESGFMEYAEGHAAAMGVGIYKDKVNALIDYSNTVLANYDFSACYDVDYEYMSNDFKAQDIIDIGSMKSLWGKGIDEAMIVIKGIKITSNNITLMSANKNPTIKITLQNGTSLIKFGASQAEFESLKSSGYTEIDVIGTCAINEWQGMITPQILIKDYEVVGKQDYYF
ncbi:MAG: DHH family phosphoesterase [Lachnospiraceae bacterium]|nr:DHH family phosphoesterase [Lachnospiraceae bacterium]MBP3906770.1 DHH family phosphoesterase [Peptostreptococcaceae bacterium]